MVTRKSRAEIETMRRAGRIVAEVLALLEAELKPGVSTAHLDALAERHIRSSGATPSFKGYQGFPASVCISIDDEVVHGIPATGRSRPARSSRSTRGRSSTAGTVTAPDPSSSERRRPRQLGSSRRRAWR
jgi:methionine aminopeptidase